MKAGASNGATEYKDWKMKNQKRVAVLGGGVASLASVWELVHRSEDVEVTVYQMGWRLGGKCASGLSLIHI